MELDFWINKIQDRTQELNKYVVQSVLLCLLYFFMYILTSKFIKNNNWKKNKQGNEIKSLNFAKSNAHRKTIVHGSFET